MSVRSSFESWNNLDLNDENDDKVAGYSIIHASEEELKPTRSDFKENDSLMGSSAGKDRDVDDEDNSVVPKEVGKRLREVICFVDQACNAAF